MKYEVRLAAPNGDTVPLVAVASTKAEVLARAGGTDFHRPAYDGSFRAFADDLLREAKRGKLKVCNCWGVPGDADALIAEAERQGDLIVVLRYLVEPDWERLRYENVPIAPGIWDFSKLDLGPSEVDWTRTHLSALFTKLAWLNEWAIPRCDEFRITHDNVEWADERGRHSPLLAPAVQAQGDSDNGVEKGPRIKKKSALIEENLHHWPTIEEDLRHGSTNKLSASAGAEAHGYWNEGAALQWAAQRGKLKTGDAATAVRPGQVHRIR